MSIYNKSKKNYFSHALMDNNITKEDVTNVINFLKNNKKRIFTQSKKVAEFENSSRKNTWCRWWRVYNVLNKK